MTEDPNTTVLVIEAGQADDYQYQIMIPLFQGLGGKDPYPNTGTCGWFNWCDMTVDQPNLNNRPILIPQGKGLGGGTLINGMLWNRGDQGDFDDWASLGNSGWDWASLLPYFEKSETFNPENNPQLATYYSIGEESNVHGFTGPQNVSFPNYFFNASYYLFEGMNELGIPAVQDPNDGNSKGAMFLPQSISGYNQSRADARRARYDPVASRPNLYVQVGQTVQRVLWASGCDAPAAGSNLTAVGVEVAPSSGAATWTATATREVIMAAGAIRTPQVLELSGIGGAAALKTGGVQQILNMPGVGENLQDHALMQTRQGFNNSDIIYPNFLQNDDVNSASHALYYANRTGPYTFGPPDGNAFLALSQFYNDTSSLASQEAGYSDDQFLASGLDPTVVAGYAAMRPLLNKCLTADNRGAIELLNTMDGTTQISNMRPFTRGSTHITNSDPFGNPALDYRYLSNPVDLTVLIQSLHFNNALYETKAVQFLQPVRTSPPVDGTDDDYTTFIRQSLGTEYHPSGTTAMLPYNLGGVVDSNLLMYNTTNVRIIDAGIMPIVPASHLQSIVYAVAEKAADIIKGAQANSQPMTPPSSLNTTSCNVGTTTKRDHVEGPHMYASHEVLPAIFKRQASGTGNNDTSKYGPAPPAPTDVGYYPMYNTVPANEPKLDMQNVASKGQPRGAALDWINQIQQNLPALLNGEVEGLSLGLQELLNGQGPLGL